MAFLREDTTVTVVIGPAVDSTGAVVTGLECSGTTIVDLYKGATKSDLTTIASTSSMISVATGFYSIILSSGSTDTPGQFRVAVGFAGALPIWENYFILDPLVYDSWIGDDYQQVDMTQVMGTAVTTGASQIGVNVFGMQAGVVSNTTFAAGSITLTAVGAGALGSGKFGTGVISSGTLGANALTAGTIAAGAISTGTLGAFSLTSGHFAAGAITLTAFGTGAIGSGKIGTGVLTSGTFGANALTAGNFAAAIFSTGTLGALSLTSGHFAAGAITLTAIGAGALGSGKFGTGVISSGTLGANALTAGTIAAGALSSGTYGTFVLTAANFDAGLAMASVSSVIRVSVLSTGAYFTAMTEDDAGTPRYTANALELGPTSAGTLSITLSVGSFEAGAITLSAFATGALGSGKFGAGALSAGTFGVGAFSSGTFGAFSLSAGNFAAAIISSGTLGAFVLSEGNVIAELAKASATSAIITTLGAAGAGLSAVPWNASWDAQVESEVTDGLNAYDPPTKAELDTGTASVQTAITAASTSVQTAISALNDITVADILAGNIETETLQQVLRLMRAVLVGKSGGGGTATLTFQDRADLKARVTATVDADGNRTAVTADGT